MRWLWRLLQWHRVRRDVAAEIEQHLREKTEELLQLGLSPDSARLQALRELGNPNRLLEESRDAWGFRWVDELGQDLRYGLRVLLKSPGLTTIAVVSLTIGIGANAAIFSVIDTVVLRPLPVPNPDELVIVRAHTRRGDRTQFSHRDYEWLNDHNEILTGLAASAPWPLTRSLGQDRERLQGQLVSPNYFLVLRVQPVLGRTMGPEDGASTGSASVAVISYSYWDRAFGRDPAAVGQSMRFGSTSVEIIGVAAKGFRGEYAGSPADIWLPLSLQPQLNSSNSFLHTRNVSWLHAMGRLRDGISIEEARASLDVLLKNLQVALHVNPQSDYLGMLTLEHGRGGLSDLRDRYARPLWILLGLVALLLIIACVNVASLLLARSEARQRELALRLAIGADRSRVIRQLLTESALLAAAACLAGLMTADVLVTILAGITDVDQIAVGLNVRVVLFTVALSSLAALAFGLAPALRGNRVNPALPLSAGRFGGAGARPTPLRVLVTAQAAIAVVLLIGAGLMLRTFLNLKMLNPGFETQQVLQVRLDTSSSPAADVALGTQLAERLAALDGVQSVSFSSFGFAQGASRVCCVDVEGYVSGPDEDRNVRVQPISPGYFSTMGIPLVRGRDFTERDDAGAPEVVIINETMARYYFGGTDPVGKRMAWWPTDPKTVEIVGVVQDAKYDNLRQDPPRMAYQSVLQRRTATHTLQIRVSAGSVERQAAIVQDCRTVIHAVDPHLLIRNVETLSAAVDRTLHVERLLASLSLAFGLVALLLSSLGVFGTLAYTVAIRTKEFGIRLALGAEPRIVCRAVIAEGLMLVLSGAVLGVGASYLLSSVAAGLLYDVSHRDPAIYASVVLILILVALVASCAPAYRATNVDPAVALRAD